MKKCVDRTRLSDILVLSPLMRVSQMLPDRTSTNGFMNTTSLCRVQSGFSVALKEKVGDLNDHYIGVQNSFNHQSERFGLEIRMDSSKVRMRINNGDIKNLSHYFNRDDDSGVLHETQIVTITEIICEYLKHPGGNGLLLGALQGGKTSTAIGLQFLGPAVFLTIGEKVQPLYLITSQNSHKDQAQAELDIFLSLYGDVELIGSDKSRCSLNDFKYDIFFGNPTLLNYRDVILGGVDDDIIVDESTEFLHRRVHGKKARKTLVRICEKACKNNVTIVVILDEFQYGASDRKDPMNPDGDRLPCVTRQYFDSINATGCKWSWIAVSATPFGLNDLSDGKSPHVWKVKQALSSDYVGINFFGGEIIHNGEIRTPEIFGFSSFGEAHNIPLMQEGYFNFPMYAACYKKSEEASIRYFHSWRQKCGYDGSYEDYLGDFLIAWEKIIDVCLYQQDEPIGFCVRATNSNEITDTFIYDLDLDPNRIEVLKFFSDSVESENTNAGRNDVKKFIKRNRKRLDLPFIIFVTGKARVGDSFPRIVRYFFDCTSITGDMNALLQGLLGRACGYHKKSTVILSDHNNDVIKIWLKEHGGHVYKSSSHTTDVGGPIRKKPSRLLRIMRADGAKVPVIREFFDLVDKAILPTVEQNHSTLKASRSKNGGRKTAPLMEIAAELKLFEQLESDAVRPLIYPHCKGDMQIARIDDKVKYGNMTEKGYYKDSAGWIGYTLRHSEAARISGRGLHARDSQYDRSAVGVYLEPQICLEKYDPTTGQMFDDRIDENGRKIPSTLRRPGNWRIHMITFPLVKSVRIIIEGSVTYPNEHSAFNSCMSQEDIEERDT